MSQDVNRYRCDLRDIRFLLFEQFGLGDLLGRTPYGDWAKDDVDAILSGVYQWACDVLGPLNAVGDRAGCTLEGGRVKTPPGFREAWQSLSQADGAARRLAPRQPGIDVGGAHGRDDERRQHRLNMYPGSPGARQVITAFGTRSRSRPYKASTPAHMPHRGARRLRRRRR